MGSISRSCREQNNTIDLLGVNFDVGILMAGRLSVQALPRFYGSDILAHQRLPQTAVRKVNGLISISNVLKRFKPVQENGSRASFFR